MKAWLEGFCFVSIVSLHVLPWALQKYVQFVPPVGVLVVTTSTAIVYWGSLRSLKSLSAVMRKRDSSLKKNEESVTLTSGDAMRVPVLGSCVLVSAYLLIKIFGKSLLNMFLTVYFTMMSTAAVASVLEAELICPGVQNVLYGRVVALGKIGNFILGQPNLDLRFSLQQLLCWMSGLCVAAVYAYSKHYLLNNLIAICLCLGALELISVGCFRNAAIMLCGLFVYDITWVFGADVMVTVAKGIDGPIKFLFLRQFANSAATERSSSDEASQAKNQFSLLGLGDIVVPGLFVAMLLRFDAHQAFSLQRIESEDNTKESFSKPYFYTALFAYALGLTATLLVMHFFDHAQPALLYLVPSVLIAVLLLSALRKEFSKLLAYSEEEDEEAATKDTDANPDSATHNDKGDPTTGESTSAYSFPYLSGLLFGSSSDSATSATTPTKKGD